MKVNEKTIAKNWWNLCKNTSLLNTVYIKNELAPIFIFSYS